MTDIKTKTALVFDYGNYISMAQRLARDFGKVYYCTNWATSFPKWNNYSIGLNVPKIERVDSMWSVIDEADIVCFPDLYQPELQEYLVTHGKAVFGARFGQDMEIYRDEFKSIMKDAGLPVNMHEVIEGFTELRKYLKDKEDLYIKTNVIRGNGETFHYKNLKLSESRLDELQHQLGAYKEEAIFVVEEPIPDACEIGYDGWVSNEKYPDLALCGVEKKDENYIGVVLPYAYMPFQLKEINKKLAGIFAGAGYKCNYSNEVRCTKDGKWFLIDQTCRIPNPPGDLQMELFENYSEIVWDVAHGVVPDLKPLGKYGVQVIIKSSWATNEAQAIYFPKKIANFVKIKNLMYKDGTAYYVPCEIAMEEIGSLVSYGGTLQEAINKIKEMAKLVEGDSISINTDALDTAAEEIKTLESFNIKLF